MDRVIVYDGALPQTTDILNTNKFSMVGQSYQNRAILGTTTVVSGLLCTPTSPTADLNVHVGVGSIYQLDPADATAYGDLGTDTAISIMKQGINNTNLTLAITPPGTAGQSQVFLVEAILNDVDAGQLTLSYFNSVPPNTPFAGPANSGTSNFTTRTCPCVIALKAGTAATTGTQTTPAPDVGYVGLYAVTVANGQTQITSPNIVQLASAPFFPTLPSVPMSVLNGAWVYAGVDTGVANAYVITFLAGQPIPTTYVSGMEVVFKALNTNTAASTINVQGIGVVPIKRGNVVALAANDIISGSMIRLTYDGTNFQMTGYLGTGTNTNSVTSVGIPYIADSGAVNALIGTYSPAITGGTQVAGLTIAIKLANTITGACTINCNGLGLKNVLLGDLTQPQTNVFVAGMVLILEYDGTQYQIANATARYRQPTANTTIFVNTSIGNDSNDGVSNTSGHALLTIQGGINKAFSYAPSQFTITVTIEPGTYNEAVLWPNFAGPNIIVDGLAAANVTVNTPNGYCFFVQGPNVATVKNLTVQNSGSLNNSCFCAATPGAQLTTSNTVSNGAAGVFLAANGGEVTPGIHSFSGSAQVLYFCLAGGTINMPAVAHTVTTAIAVSLATAVVESNGVITVNPSTPTTFTNPTFVSGSKYALSLNGIINTNGLGTSYFPGTLVGTQTTGGQYG
jgi:hypothetical protein